MKMEAYFNTTSTPETSEEFSNLWGKPPHSSYSVNTISNLSESEIQALMNLHMKCVSRKECIKSRHGILNLECISLIFFRTTLKGCL